MKKFNRILSLIMVLCMVFTMLPATSALAVVEKESVVNAAAPSLREQNEAILANAPEKAGNSVSIENTDGSVTINEIEDLGIDLKAENSEVMKIDTPEADEIVRVIVVLEGKALVEQGYSTEQISANGAAVANAVNNMRVDQNAVVNEINSIVKNLDAEALNVTAKYNYNVLLNGIAVEVPYAAVETIKGIPGVANVYVASQYSVPEDMSGEAASPNMYATKDIFGSAETWETRGYTGEGMRIAIIDTGLDIDHPSFADAPAINEYSLTIDEIASVIENLNAYSSYNAGNAVALTADDLYYSEKVPFAFNYVDVSLDATHDNDGQGDHGSHVAGIAAANELETTTVVGVAPDAQVIVMKVFGANGGAYSDDIVAALEDCFVLNVDAVNMSLGSPAGFSSEDDYLDAIYGMIQQTDMVVSISAGNSTSSAYGNTLGTNKNFTSDPDNGIVGSPATYTGATVVASVENASYMSEYFTIEGVEGKFVYNDASIADATTVHLAFCLLALSEEGTAYEYVMIPGVGDVTDFEGVDVAGKIAVIQRGTIDFTAKQTNAYNAGAVACIVYNNVENDDAMYMMNAGLLPNVFVSKAVGDALASGADANGVGTLTVMPYGEMAEAENPSAGQMSSFSSWGVTPDLQLVPDVTAPGGNIYSCYTDGQYGMMSGTSMAAPHIVGMSALVLQYLRDNYTLYDAVEHTVAEALIMSTAEPLTDVTGYWYSPRLQGAGSANVLNAVTSPAYLTINGSTPKVSLGEDEAKTGVYEFTFELNNMSDAEHSYALDASVLTDLVDTSYADYDMLFMSEMSLGFDDAEVVFEVLNGASEIMAEYDLNGDGLFDRADVAYLLDVVNGVEDGEGVDLNADGKVDTADAQALLELLDAIPTTKPIDNVVSVAAHTKATIKVTITLSEDDKAYMDAYYPNGIYVDGFVRCYTLEEGCVDLSLPFMGFYGDWSASRIFDSAWYFDETATPERYYHVLFTNFGGDDYGYNLGLNPYINEEYDSYHNVLSPNGDGYQDNITEVYLGMMRNAKVLSMDWTYADTGESYVGYDFGGARKSYYNSLYRVCLPFMTSSYGLMPVVDMSDLPNGTALNLDISAWLDDGDDIVDDQLETIPIYIDTEAPVIVEDTLQYVYDETTDSRYLYFDVQDNHDIAALIPITMTGDPIEYIAVEDENGEAISVMLDVSGYDSSFVLAVCDYGANESYYEITFKGEKDIDTDKFYAYRRYSSIDYYGDGSYYIVTDAYNGWHSFETADNMLMHTAMYDGETAVAAAEYIDGYIFGVDIYGEIFAIKAGDWTRISIGSMPTGYDANYEEMAYPALDMTYDYTTDTLYILTDELVAGDGGHLMQLDYMTGEVTDLGIVKTSEGSQALTLACDNDGVMYTIDYLTGDLYTIDVTNPTIIEAENWWESDVTYYEAELVGSTGYVPLYAQSMTVDHETNTLYWMAYASAYSTGYMLAVDTATAELTPVSYVEDNAEMVAFFKPYDSGEDIIPDAELEAIVLNKELTVLGVGGADVLTAAPYPFNSELGELTWSSSNENVAVVFEGYVYAVGEGSAVVTVSNGTLSAECTVEVVNLTSDLTFYDMGSNYAWQTLNAAAPADAEILWDATNPYNGFTAAAYFNGKVYAAEYGGNFYCLDAETMQGTQIGSCGSTLVGMAFNYADGYMYGIEQYSAGMWETYNYLVRVNLNTGALERIEQISSDYTALGTLAIDYEGNIYAICGDNQTYDIVLVKWTVGDEGMVVEGSWSLGESGYGVSNLTSMTYSAKDNGIYYSDGYGVLYWIDMASLSAETLRVVNLGYIGEAMGYAMNMGMFTVPETEPELPAVELTAVNVPGSYMLMVGGSVSAGVTVEPWNAYPAVSYAIADETIATVAADGTITGIAAGSTTLTVTVEGWDGSYAVPVTVVESAGTLYGFLISDFMYGGDFFVSFTDTDPVNEIAGISDYTNFTVFSGAYHDGVIYGYGQDATGELDYKNYFLTIDAETFEIVGGAKINYTLRDMAMDYTSNNIYAIAEGAEYAGAVAVVDRETGEVTIIADTGIAFSAMTIDANGQMYGISEDDNLYAIDKTTGELTLIGDTGVDAGALFQSMHYDLDTGNTYWAQVADDQSSSLRIVDLATGSTTSLGTISASGAEVSALYTIPGNEPTVPDEETFKVTGIKLPEVATVVKDETLQLKATVLTSVELKPGTMSTNATSAADVTVTWSSSDESVATVDATGLVTGIAAGEVVITAYAEGHSATCKVVVTEGERLLYAYDETNAQWISFTAADPATINTERADAEGEAKLVASTYTGETIYAYDENGMFYSIDAETFERTALGSGINGQTYMVETTDWWSGDTYEVECQLSIVDMSYDNGTLYAAVSAYNEDEWIDMALLCTVDVTSGAITVVFESGEIKPTNLLVDNGMAYFVDGGWSGLLTYVDLTADAFAYSQAALVQGYWGYADASVGLFKDKLTGTVYALRDFTDIYDEWDGVTGDATLCTLNLADADIAELGTIGSGLLLNGLFIK